MERVSSAPVERASADELRRESVLVRSALLVQSLIDSMPVGVAILNDKRQVVAANLPLLEMVQGRLEDMVGRRLGEVFGCCNWKKGPDGCGTAPSCRDCGILQACKFSQLEGQAIRECDLALEHPIKGAPLELRAKATSASIQGESFIICALEDISSQKRLSELSAIFFHDVLNMVGGIQGHLGLLGDRQAAGEAREDFQLVQWLSDQLVDELVAQRDLMLAESGDLEVQPQVVRTSALVEDLRRVYTHHASGAGRCVQTGEVWEGTIITDVRLLGRVLGNMLRNALEATPPGGTVTVCCTVENDHVAFRVHNPDVIPEQLQGQLFKRPISTKRRGRQGVGARSMKLLGEHYLGGEVSFVSRPPVGTTFTLRVPKVLSPPLDRDVCNKPSSPAGG